MWTTFDLRGAAGALYARLSKYWSVCCGQTCRGPYHLPTWVGLRALCHVPLSGKREMKFKKKWSSTDNRNQHSQLHDLRNPSIGPLLSKADFTCSCRLLS